MSRLIAWLCASRIRQALLLIAVCCAAYLPRLGSTGFSMSEGHRVVPAWEMLEDARAGDPHWLVPRMFGTAYLRKPPGVMWAIAGSSAVLGETEFAARLPSAAAATLLALAVWWFGTRWFGSPWGLAAGLAQALLPVTWPSARSAEIESLHVMTTGVACLLLVEAVVGRTRWRWLALAGASLVLMSLVKGPAGAPFVAGALLGAGAVRKSLRGLMIPGIVAVLAGAALVSWGIWSASWSRASGGGTPIVSQGVDDFMWEPGATLRILTLGPAVLATMLPVSLALLFPWGPDLRAERARERDDRSGSATPTDIALVLGIGAVSSLVILTGLGIANPRYGLPVCALLSPLVAYAARGAAGAFARKRPAIARAMLAWPTAAWPALLLVGATAYVALLEPQRRESSGREAGIGLAAHLPDGAEVWADEVIEARPEVLLYAVREAERQGRRVGVRWLKPGFMPSERPDGLLLLLREDDLVDEVRRIDRQGSFGALTPIARGEVHKYTFVLVRPEP